MGPIGLRNKEFTMNSTLALWQIFVIKMSYEITSFLNIEGSLQTIISSNFQDARLMDSR